MVSLLILSLVLALASGQEEQFFPGLQRVIFGGARIQRDKTPWQVFVKETEPAAADGSVVSGVCGGTIIGKRTILTAAHCTMKPGVKVHVLINQDTRRDEESIMDQVAEQVVIHPEYAVGGGADSSKDLAILLLPQDIPLQRGLVEAARLATSEPEIGERCLQSGYGTVRERNNDPGLRMAYNNVHECFSPKEGQICMSGEINEERMEGSICQGDSGGPLICGGELAGVVSATSSTSTAGQCRESSVFASVSHNKEWIDRTLRGMGQPTSQNLGGGAVNMNPDLGAASPRRREQPVAPTPVEPQVREPVRREPVLREPIRREPVVEFPSPIQPRVRDSRRVQAGPNGRTPKEQFHIRFGDRADPCGEKTGSGWKLIMTPLPQVSSMQISIWESDRYALDVALGYSACLNLGYDQYREAREVISAAAMRR